MLTIVTGNIDVGKTTYFLNWFNIRKEGYGVATKKIFSGGIFIGYNLITLPDNIEYPFIYLKDQVLFDPLKHIAKGRFIFLKKTFDLANEYLFASFEKHKIIWVDEVGTLEINELGFHSFLKEAIRSERHLIIAVKETTIPSIVEYYNIKEYEIVYVNRKYAESKESTDII